MNRAESKKDNDSARVATFIVVAGACTLPSSPPYRLIKGDRITGQVGDPRIAPLLRTGEIREELT